MASLLESAKAFGKKITGKDIESQSLIDVLDETTEKYEKSESPTYTAGNGITITEDNTINADTKVVVYNGDLTKIPRRTLESLNTGDILNVFGYYYYVSVKNQWEIRITGFDSNSIITYFYSKDGEYYKYSRQEWRSVPLYNGPAVLDGDEGEIDWETYDQIDYFVYCLTDYGMAISIGWDEETDTIKLATVVQDNKYYTVSFTYNEPESEEEEDSYSYTITEHTLGGEIINLTFDTTEIDLETAEKLTGSNKNNYIIELNDNTETSPGIYLRPNGEYINVWTSNIIDGSYWEFKITDWQEEGIYVSIEQIPVGGQQTINLADVETLTRDQFFAIKQKDVRVTCDDIDLLLSKWDEENDYPILTSAVCDDEYLQVTFSENEMGEADTEQTYSFVIDAIPVENKVLVLDLENYEPDPTVRPKEGQWDNATASIAMGEGKLVFITSGRYRVWLISMIEFPGEDVSSYTVAIQGAVTSDHSVVGIGWDDNNQMFYFNSGPK